MFKTTLARENWESKYQYKNETPEGTFQRVARALASVEKDKEYWYDKFLKVMVNFDKEGNAIGLKFTPGGRITSNLGTDYKKATVINCFIGGPVSSASVKYKRKSEEAGISYDVEYSTDDNPDDLTNIFLTVLEQAKTLASEGGYGINFDFIRPRGSIIKGLGIRHPGVLAYMKIWDSVSECIVKGTNDGYVDKLKNYLDEESFAGVKDTLKAMARKGAMMSVLSINHPDIEEYIRVKQISGVLTKFNTSVLIDDKFMECVEKDEFYDLSFKGKIYKKVKARDLYDLVMTSTYNRAEPGVLFVDNMHRGNPMSYLGRCNATNPCVSPETLILTTEGHVEIGPKENEYVDVWNGFEYSRVLIKKTGHEKELLKVSFSNGEILECTETHEFLVQVGFKRDGHLDRIKTVDLKPGYRLAKYELPIIHKGSKIFEHAYTHGFFCADGCYKYPELQERPKVALYGEKRNLAGHLETVSGSGIPTKQDSLNYYLPDDLMPKFEIPLNGYRIEDRLDWFAGYADGDGTICVDDTGNQSLQITSVCRSFLLKIRLMLQTLGIDSKVTKSHDAQLKQMPDGRGGSKEYSALVAYRLLVSSWDLYKLSQLGWNPRRLKFTPKKPNRQASQFTKVVSVERTGRIDDTYCFTEPKNHTGMFNGIMTGQCGEVPGLSTLTTVCLLGSFNLTQYVKMNPDKSTYFDFETYKEDIVVSVRMLDNVNDLTYSPLPSYLWAIKNLRQIGIGINGLGSALYMLGIAYNSKEAVDFAKKVCEMKENTTWQASALLAVEKGVFSAYKKHEFENTEYFKSDRLSPETKSMLRKYGARNGKTTTQPPLGNSSIVTDNVSNGIEPVIDLECERKVICKDWPLGLNKDNVEELLKLYKEKDYKYWKGEYNGKKYYYEPHNRGLCGVDIVRDYGYQWILDNMPEKKKADFIVTTKDLEIEDHLNIQGIVQRYVNQSVSKTCNLPKTYPFSKFKDLYMGAWKKGLVGFTTYREGSMESVISGIGDGSSNEIIKKDIKLPSEFINGPCRVIKKEGKKFYIHFSYLPEDNAMKFPVVMWIHTNAKYQEKDDLKICNKAARELAKLAYKCGIDEKIIEGALSKAREDYPHNRLGRMISLNLRHNVPREDILVSLTGLEGDSISSLLAAVRKYVGETVPDGTVLKGLKCHCGGDLYMESGCKRCRECKTQFCG